MPPAARYRTLKVISTRSLSEGAYVLRLERQGLDFLPGQCLTLGELGSHEMRDYSIYSGSADPFLEVLIREIPDGVVSRSLRRLQPGSEVAVEGPSGFFTLPEAGRDAVRHVFVATGTGVAPFHSYLASYPELDFILLHGVRTLCDAYLRGELPASRYIPCLSQGAAPDSFPGRVTDWLARHDVDPEAHYSLCGNARMIYDAFEHLLLRGVPSDRIHSEVYF